MRGTVAKKLRKKAYAGSTQTGGYHFDPRVQATRFYFVKDTYTGKVLERTQAEAAYVQEYGYLEFIKNFYKDYTPIHVSKPVISDIYRRQYRVLKREYTSGERIWQLEFQNSPEAIEWRRKAGR